MRRAIDAFIAVLFVVIAGLSLAGAARNTGSTRWILIGATVIDLLAATSAAIPATKKDRP